MISLRFLLPVALVAILAGTGIASAQNTPAPAPAPKREKKAADPKILPGLTAAETKKIVKANKSVSKDPDVVEAEKKLAVARKEFEDAKKKFEDEQAKGGKPDKAKMSKPTEAVLRADLNTFMARKAAAIKADPALEPLYVKWEAGIRSETMERRNKLAEERSKAKK